MKALGKKIVVFNLITVLLVSTMGFTVSNFYCYCTGQVYTSLSDSEPSIASDMKMADMPCCHKKMQCVHQETKNKKCGDRQVKHYKLHSPFSAIEKIKLPEFANEAVALLPSGRYIYSDFPESFSLTNCPNKAPPPRYGKSLLKFIQVYRC